VTTVAFYPCGVQLLFRTAKTIDAAYRWHAAEDSEPLDGNMSGQSVVLGGTLVGRGGTTYNWTSSVTAVALYPCGVQLLFRTAKTIELHTEDMTKAVSFPGGMQSKTSAV
jgi:hypothetical protein